MSHYIPPHKRKNKNVINDKNDRFPKNNTNAINNISANNKQCSNHQKQAATIYSLNNMLPLRYRRNYCETNQNNTKSNVKHEMTEHVIPNKTRWNRSERYKIKEHVNRRNSDNINYIPEQHNNYNKKHSSHHRYNPIINTINSAHSDKQILQILKTNNCSISVYVKAVEKLIKCWGHYRTVYKIIDIMNDEGKEIPMSIYSILITALCLNDKLDKALCILKEIETDNNLCPNGIIFNNLLSGCKRKGDIENAEMIWNKMINEYKIIPTRTSYMSIIAVYANSRQLKQCQDKFNEIVNQTSEYDMDKLGAICNNMLKVYGSCDDKQKFEDMREFMVKHNIPFTIIEYTTMMRGYVIFEECDKVFEIFEKIKNRVKLDNICIGVLGVAYLKCIKLWYQKNTNSIEIDKYLSLLKDVIPKQYPKLIDKQYELTIFRGILWKYLNNWQSIDVYNVFNNLSDSFGYWSNNKNKNKNINEIPMINVHGFSHIATRFILRHIFCYETHNLRIAETIFVVCGKGLHRLHQHTNTINQTVINELNSWIPRIRVSIDNKQGRVRLNEYDVMQFLKRHKNINQSTQCFPNLTYDTVFK